MSPVSLEALITPLTPKQIKTAMYEKLALLGASTTAWNPGGVARLMIAIFAVVASAFSITIAALARSAFLTLSSGPWLTLVARYVFGTERFPATAAAGTITLVNTLGGNFPRDAYAVTVAGPGGKTYRNSVAFTLPPLGSVTVPFLADESGSGSNAGVGTIQRLVTTMPGVSVSNPVAFVGRDEETDDALIARAMLKPQSISPDGARGAYKWFALTATRASDGSLIGVNRVNVSHSSYFGEATVTVATPAGALSDADLADVDRHIFENALPGGVLLTVRTATNYPISVSFWAYFDRENVSASEQTRIGIAALTPWLSSTEMPIGGVTIAGVAERKVLRDTIRDVLSQGFVDAGYGRPRLVRVWNPTADVSVGETQVPVPGVISAVPV
jgi:hypothetical protein